MKSRNHYLITNAIIMHLRHLSKAAYKLRRQHSSLLSSIFSHAYNQLRITALKFIKNTLLHTVFSTLFFAFRHVVKQGLSMHDMLCLTNKEKHFLPCPRKMFWLQQNPSRLQIPVSS